MATLHLICGLPCAGKTTMAKQPERDLPALRLAADEWMACIVGREPITMGRTAPFPVR